MATLTAGLSQAAGVIRASLSRLRMVIDGVVIGWHALAPGRPRGRRFVLL